MGSPWGVTARVLEGPGFLEDLRAEWDELLLDAPTATPFQTPEWQIAWWNLYRTGRQARAIEVREGRDLVGLYPLTLGAGPWRTLRAMGTGPSDYLHPIVRAGFDLDAMIGDALRAMRGVDLIDLHGLREDAPLAAMATDDQARCLVLDLPPTYDAFLASLGKSLRFDCRRLDKAPFKDGKATVETNPEDGLDILFDLHRARWRAKRLPGAFVGRLVPFQRAWFASALSKGYLRLSVLRLEGQPIGALYAMALGQGVYYYQAGFAPTEGAISPGTLLVAYTVRQAIDEGRTRFDFLRGDEGYKRRWKPQRVFADRRAVVPLNARGRLGAAWIRRAAKIEAKVRARLEG